MIRTGIFYKLTSYTQPVYTLITMALVSVIILAIDFAYIRLKKEEIE